jgi:hypothetical protein
MPAGSPAPALRRARELLATTGVLLLHDARWPSLTALVAGAPIRGSWWGHPAGREIFQVASALEDGGEVLFVPLLDGKVTLLHRSLWNALASVGEAREPWQLAGLDRTARALLAEVDEAGRLRASGTPAKTLARALLVHAAQVHTEQGAHATELQAWHAFRRQHRLGRRRPLAAARSELQAATGRALGEPAVALLPWVRGA